MSSTSSATALIGAWQRTLILQTSNDITTSRTIWLFGGDGSCQRTVETTTASAGYTDTVRTACAYRVDGTRLAILYAGTSGEVTFSWAVQGSTLTLNGDAFQRA